MNEIEAKELAGKVMKCDRIIYEQQLGLVWVPPEVSITNLDIASFAEIQGSKKRDEPGRSGESVHSGYPEGHESVSKHSLQVSMTKIKRVFTLLVDEASFLIEEKVKDQCARVSEKEQLTLKIDSIRKTLGIEVMEDIQMLVSLFYPPRDDLYEGDGEQIDSDELMVASYEVFDILTQFLDK